jgi:c-di-GMP-binding flagellar brake protein YcgR
MELPSEIWRIQRRAGFRITALSGTEITFHIHPEKEKKAKVKDYSLGGVAFFLEKDVKLDMNDKVTNIHLRLPQSGEFRTIHVVSAVVRRVELDAQGKYLCALEFLEFPENSKQQLWNYMIDTQRTLIRKLKSI